MNEQAKTNVIRKIALINVYICMNITSCRALETTKRKQKWKLLKTKNISQ